MGSSLSFDGADDTGRLVTLPAAFAEGPSELALTLANRDHQASRALLRSLHPAGCKIILCILPLNGVQLVRVAAIDCIEILVWRASDWAELMPQLTEIVRREMRMPKAVLNYC